MTHVALHVELNAGELVREGQSAAEHEFQWITSHTEIVALAQRRTAPNE